MFGLHRETVDKMLANPTPPGYRRKSPPRHAQCDFGQAWAIIGGAKRKFQYFVMSLPVVAQRLRPH